MAEREVKTFLPEHVKAAHDLIDAVEQHYQDTGQPFTDGEAEITSVILAARVAGLRCPGYDKGIQSLGQTLAETVYQVFLGSAQLQTYEKQVALQAIAEGRFNAGG